MTRQGDGQHHFTERNITKAKLVKTMNKNDLRIIFMGTPEFAVETLKALVDNDYHVVAVVTQPDKAVGRHASVLQPSAVKQYALEKGLPVLQPVKMKDPLFVEQLRSYQANLQVVVAFRMLPEVVWAMPEYGTFNVHAALLPQYRGAAPINWAVINGETLTGVTTFFLDHDIDTGRIIQHKTFAIPDDADVAYVYDGLMHLGAALCLETLQAIIEADGHPHTVSQDSCSSVDGSSTSAPLKPAPKIFKETCQIAWTKTAKEVYDFVRGLSPSPGAWTTLTTTDGKPTVLKIYKTLKTGLKGDGPGSISIDGKHLYISAADEKLEITFLQQEGKKRMAAVDFLNGMKDKLNAICH